jgi:hypothetical protein
MREDAAVEHRWDPGEPLPDVAPTSTAIGSSLKLAPDFALFRQKQGRPRFIDESGFILA